MTSNKAFAQRNSALASLVVTGTVIYYKKQLSPFYEAITCNLKKSNKLNNLNIKYSHAPLAMVWTRTACI